MKIRIIKKNRLIKESTNTTTARYRQTQPRATGEITHAPEEIQQSRIEIGLNIDRFLQRPFVTVGEEIMDDDGEMRTITDPKETNLLLYLYRGVDPSGKLMNNEDIAAVNRELKQRVNHFLMGLSQFDKKVLASDIDFIIQSMSEERSSEQTPSHQSSRMLKTAPGHFDDFSFGTRTRSIYKDTRAGKDFMLKKTPELKNIPEQHHFLFSMENLMGRVKSSLGEQSGENVPPLDAVSYDANYRLGDTTQQIETERDRDAQPSEMNFGKAVRNLFLVVYSNPDEWVKYMSPEKQLELYGPYFVMLLLKVKDRLEKAEYPAEFFELEKIADNVPQIFFDKYEQAIESYIMGIEAHGFEERD